MKKRRRNITIRKLEGSFKINWLHKNGDYIEVLNPIPVNHCPTCGNKLRKVKP